VETGQYSELPSYDFVFIGDMVMCFGRITVSHPCEFLSTLVQGVRAVYEWVQPETDMSGCLHWRGHMAPGRYNLGRVPAYVRMTLNHMNRMLSRHRIKCVGVFRMTNITLTDFISVIHVLV
jgi:hypothetical protein